MTQDPTQLLRNVPRRPAKTSAQDARDALSQTIASPQATPDPQPQVEPPVEEEPISQEELFRQEVQVYLPKRATRLNLASYILSVFVLYLAVRIIVRLVTPDPLVYHVIGLVAGITVVMLDKRSLLVVVAIAPWLAEIVFLLLIQVVSKIAG